MKFFCGIPVIAVVLLLLPTAYAKMHVYFNNHFMGFGFDHIQRCYTISHCWDDHSQDSEWTGLPDQAQIVWFEDKYCTGNSMSRDESKGFIDFEGSKLFNKVSSFMVRQGGLYPTEGMVDYCHEGAPNSSATDKFFFDLQ